ncbi:NTE family protein [Clostridium cavendishii DSM 21758]|uniref:NTE family protein n=1 Tax=Clostridium cavendishii DSM 21758 TaxID=1121302 RepID=A0A1M6VMZ9_9CLOT|nr:patatin-like phospholipase family protein [Clostridium cavendishii]SHK82878.1 NTE family protein [Clostridium cavendishii DSM 21758]
MKVGLVLAGGGGRGAYEIGVWKALKELGIDKYIQVVSGTSIGALNAVLFIQGDLELAEKVWYSISNEAVLPTNNIDLLKKGILLALGAKNINFVKKYIPKALEQGNISRQGLIDVMDKYIDFPKVKNSNVKCYAACSEIPTVKARYFRINEYEENKIRKILLATSAMPVVYECEEIDNRKYVDGGMVDNVPIQPVYGEGCDIIIVVYLDKFPTLERRKFPNTKIIEIIPKDMDCTVINGTFNFSQECIPKRIQQGYEDTIYLLEPIFELSKYKFIKTPIETVSTVSRNIIDLVGKMCNKSKDQESIANE